MDSSLASTFALTSVSTLVCSALEQPQSASLCSVFTGSGTCAVGTTASGAFGASGAGVSGTHFPSLYA